MKFWIGLLGSSYIFSMATLFYLGVKYGKAH